jgi:hypothetical protein
MGRGHSERGTTLVEAVVAIGLLAGAVVVLAGLSHLAVRSATLARERSLAGIQAVQKMEALCRDVRSLSTSPGDALDSDSPGFVEYLDARGNVTAGEGAMFVRRWSVTAMTPDADLLAIQVDAAVCRGKPGLSRCADAATHVRLAGVRSRLAW